MGRIGRWTQIDLEIFTKPEIRAIKAKCKLTEFEAVGRIVAWFVFIENEAIDGLIKNADRQVVADVLGGSMDIVDILVMARWLAFDERGAIVLNWEKRFSNSARRRRQEAERKAEARYEAHRGTSKRPKADPEPAQPQASPPDTFMRTQCGQIAPQSGTESGHHADNGVTTEPTKTKARKQLKDSSMVLSFAREDVESMRTGCGQDADTMRTDVPDLSASTCGQSADCPNIEAARERERVINTNTNARSEPGDPASECRKGSARNYPHEPGPYTEWEWPIIGMDAESHGGKYQLPVAWYDELKAGYPGTDVDAALRECRQWILANMTKRKTYGGMRKFIQGWLSRNTDRGRYNRGDVAPVVDQPKKFRRASKTINPDLEALKERF